MLTALESRPNVFVLATVLAALLMGCSACRPDASPEIPPTADSLRILAYNIHHGEGMDEVIDLERIAALIREVKPDLVTLQEVDSVVARTNGVDQAAELGRMTGMQPVFGRFMAYQGGAYGMALLSGWDVTHSTNIRLPDGDEPRASVMAEVVSPATGRALRLVGIHFYRTEAERLAQATSLEDQLAQRDGAAPMPTILAGDFNSQPSTAVMDHLAQSWTILDKGEDNFTFSSWAPEREIDFVLLDQPGRFEGVRHWLLDEPVISDHRPVVVDLVWKP